MPLAYRPPPGTVDEAVEHGRGPRYYIREHASVLIAVALAVLAVGIRQALVFRSPGGPSGNFGYDAGVYYNAADALIHGRLPYRDFVLLHPPGLMLALTPFAALGQVVGDHGAFMVANAAFTVIGGLNAALVFAIGRRMGLARQAAAIGGLFYAGWLGAAVPEFSSRLEPLGNLALLIGLYLLTGRRTPTSLLASGAAFGVAASVKIWWVAPALIIVIWLASTGQRDAARRVLSGTIAGAVLVNGPFFVLAPGAMYRMVVTDQLGRPTSTRSPVTRVADLSSLRTLDAHLATPVLILLMVGAAALMTYIARAAWRTGRYGKLVVAVGVGELLVLLLAPTFFGFYSGFAATGSALVVAAGAEGLRHHRSALPRLAAPAATGVVAVITALALLTGSVSVSKPFPHNLAARVTHVHCLLADSPMALIQLDALSRDLAHGCPNWVDVTGRTYDSDAPVGRYVPRTENIRWQYDVRRYLLSGNAFVTIRPASGLSSSTKDLLSDQPVLARSHGVVIHRVPAECRLSRHRRGSLTDSEGEPFRVQPRGGQSRVPNRPPHLCRDAGRTAQHTSRHQTWPGTATTGRGRASAAGDTGTEPVTPTVSTLSGNSSGKRSMFGAAHLLARGVQRVRRNAEWLYVHGITEAVA